ncbi:MAG TPA: orange carotenoid protein N-terminal domain-containing protein [Leptolyngbyaceae cyanobacterium]
MTSLQTDFDRLLSQSSKDIYQGYEKLSTDDKLALLYYIYEKMGGSITPAAPIAADPELANPVIESIYQQSPEEQLNTMRQIVNREDTPLSRAYGGLIVNAQLLIWYVWAEEMGNRVVDIPNDYTPAQGVQQLLDKIQGLEFQEQISLMREMATHMGHSDVQSPPTQAETGVTPSL